MFCRSTAWFISAILLGMFGTPVGAQDDSTNARWFPPGAIAYAETNGIGQALTRFEQSDLFESLQQTPQSIAYYESLNYQKLVAVRELSSRFLREDSFGFLKKLLGHQLALGVYPVPGRPRPDILVLVRPETADVVQEIREILQPALLLIDQQSRVETMASGWLHVKAPQNIHVILADEWIAVSSSEQLLNRQVELIGSQSTESLAASSDRFLARWKQMKPDQLVRAWLDLDAVRTMSGNESPLQLDNALGSLLFGHALLLGRESPDLVASFDATAEQFQVQVSASLSDKTHEQPWQSFFSASASRGAPVIPPVDGLIAGFTIYRDFDAWYRGREILMKPDSLPDFDKFETGLANLLPGKDFGEDVLPYLGDSFTILAAPQKYDHLDGEPGVKFPGIAVVFEMDDVEQAGGMFDLFFQTLSAILNIQAGQQGRQPWVMSSESHNGIQINYGRYLTRPEGDSLPFVFNFMPASARVGRHYVITTSRDLCRRLVDYFQSPAAESVSELNRNFELKLLSGPLIEALRSNQEFFVAQGVKQGKSLDQATREFELALGLGARLKSLAFWTSVADEAFEVHLQGDWK